MTSLSSCTSCELHRTCVTVGVASRGDGRILLVGEAPGAQEDIAGVPFVGKAGVLLETMLRSSGISDYALTNAVRCRPPKNRKPTPAEINACRGHLIEEIRERDPLCIVALGDTALRSLTGHSGVAKFRGQTLALHKSFGLSIPVACTYHPAFVLRVPQMQQTVEADLRRIRDRDNAEIEVPWQWSDQVPEGQVVAWDIETDYNFETKSGGDNVIQLAYAGDGAVAVTTNPASASALWSRATTVTHNGWAFDVPKMAASGVNVPLGADTMVLAYLEDETQPLGLEALCVKYLGVKGWKEGIHAVPGSDAFALYNARDADYTRRLYHVLVGRLGHRKALADHIIGPAYQALRACSARGIWIDREAVLVAKEKYTQRRAKGARAMAVLGGIENPNSNLEVARALLIEGHQLPYTDTGLPSTGASVLASLEQTKLVQAVRYHRKAAKAVAAFVNPYLAATETSDGRVHPLYTLWRTVTGRSSAMRPNVQQLDRMLRAFFSAPPGYELAQADYAAIEFRLGAFVAGCPSIIARYAADPFWDPHRWFAALLYQKPEAEVSKAERQIAKSANFGLLYMAQWFTLQEYTLKTTGILLSEQEAKGIRSMWHKTFPEFREWYRKTNTVLHEQGFIESLTGRRRHYGDPALFRVLPDQTKEGFLREAVNMQVQSLGADVALAGLSACHQAGLPINGFFHDANSFEFPEGTTPTHLGMIRECMVEEPAAHLKRFFGIDLTVPIVIEVKTKENTWVL